MPTKEKSRQLPALPPPTQISNGSVPAGTNKPDVRGGFTMIPNAVLLDSSVSLGAKQLYAVLAHHQGSNAEAWPSQKLLAAELGVASVSTVRRYLRELEKAGLIKTRQVGLHRTNRYTVVNSQPLTTDRVAPSAPQTLQTPNRSSMSVPKGRRTSKPALSPKPLHYVQSLSRQSSLLPSPSSSPLRYEESAEARRVESHFSSGEVFEVEEQPQLADSHSTFEYTLEDFEQLGGCLAALYSTTGEQDSPDLGIEPRSVAESSGQVAERTTEGERVSETEEARSKREHEERKAAGVCIDCGEPEGLEIYRDCSRCASCRAGHEEVDRKYGLGRFAAPETEALASVPGQSSDEDERLPWEQDDTPPAEERLPWEKPEHAPATKRDLEGAVERLGQKLDELPATLAIAIGGHPAEEAGQYTAAAAEEGQLRE